MHSFFDIHCTVFYPCSVLICCSVYMSLYSTYGFIKYIFLYILCRLWTVKQIPDFIQMLICCLFIYLFFFLYSSHFQLSFSERYSSFQLYGGWDTDKYSSLVHMPIQDSKDFHNLGEILSNGQNLSQQHVNILAMIKHVSLLYVCVVLLLLIG